MRRLLFLVPILLQACLLAARAEADGPRRPWLGVRVMQLSDEIADVLKIKPARGALVAGVEDMGPAKAAGIESGDVVIRFDSKDIKVPEDLTGIVADSAPGRDVDVVIIRKGKEETRKITLGSR
jgi:serine protease Do